MKISRYHYLDLWRYLPPRWKSVYFEIKDKDIFHLWNDKRTTFTFLITPWIEWINQDSHSVLTVSENTGEFAKSKKKDREGQQWLQNEEEMRPLYHNLHFNGGNRLERLGIHHLHKIRKCSWQTGKRQENTIYQKRKSSWQRDMMRICLRGFTWITARVNKVPLFFLCSRPGNDDKQQNFLRDVYNLLWL